MMEPQRTQAIQVDGMKIHPLHLFNQFLIARNFKLFSYFIIFIFLKRLFKFLNPSFSKDLK
jgi:hypothetical protein